MHCRKHPGFLLWTMYGKTLSSQVHIVCTLYLLYVRSVSLCPSQCYILKHVHHFLGIHQYQAQVFLNKRYFRAVIHVHTCRMGYRDTYYIFMYAPLLCHLLFLLLWWQGIVTLNMQCAVFLATICHQLSRSIQLNSTLILSHNGGRDASFWLPGCLTMLFTKPYNLFR